MPDSDTRPTQTSSPRTSSSSSRQTAAPNYLSARSADVILSEVRPTRIKSEALRSVNVLLDELLWLILGYARSFATDRLRMGLLKILPTNLGKDALLEAEVELRAYIERNPPLTPLQTDEPTIQKFPLQPAFELLRTKCETYSSLGDKTEDPEAESVLYSRMVQVAGDGAPKFSAAAPAALYLTAILEHICEHVLSNVGQVVARDSSRTTAHVQDLYIALCEDESIYSLFKTMKVQDQIEQQAKMPPPRRSKSISRNETIIEAPAEATSDTHSALPKSRHSLDSAVSNGSNHLSNRTSVDKSRSKVLLKNSGRTPITDNGNSNASDVLARHRRSNSLLGSDKRYNSDETSKIESSADALPADEDSMQDFDDLMRSGTTMKVSLTPDRLKTFEVFAKEKNQRVHRPANAPSSPSGREISPPSSYPNGASHIPKVKQQAAAKGRNRVESISETPEDQVRARSSSVTTPIISKEEKIPPTPRAPSFTEARSTSAKVDNKPLPPSNLTDSTDGVSTSQRMMATATIDPSTGMPKRAHRRAVRRRESLDLEDVMNGSDDDLPIAKKMSLTPKSAQTTTSGARDLMDFLSEGPPEPFTDPAFSSAPSAYDPQRPNKGRFRNIVSRLTGSTSNEKLSTRGNEEGTDTTRRPTTLAVNGGAVHSRPPPLNPKRSAPNVSVGARPMPQSSSTAVSSPSHEVPPSPTVQRNRQQSLTRKAVPNWESRDIPKENESPRPMKTSRRGSDAQKPLPEPAVSSTVQPPSITSNEATSAARRRAPRDSEQSQDPSTTHIGQEVQIASPVPTYRTGKSEQESVKQVPPVPPRSDRRTPTSTPFIPSDELIWELRRLMASATTADECRVLMEMFLARCGTSDNQQKISGPITPPVFSESESRYESNLIDVLLGDVQISPVSPPTATPAAPLEEDSATASTGHAHHQPVSSLRPDPQDGSRVISPVLPPAQAATV